MYLFTVFSINYLFYFILFIHCPQRFPRAWAGGNCRGRAFSLWKHSHW